jgi:hypothetical protein
VTSKANNNIASVHRYPLKKYDANQLKKHTMELGNSTERYEKKINKLDNLLLDVQQFKDLLYQRLLPQFSVLNKTPPGKALTKEVFQLEHKLEKLIATLDAFTGLPAEHAENRKRIITMIQVLFKDIDSIKVDFQLKL